MKHFTLEFKVTVYEPNLKPLRINDAYKASFRVQANSLEEAMSNEHIPTPTTEYVEYKLLRVIEHRDDVVVWIPGTITLQEYKLVFTISGLKSGCGEFYRNSIQYNLEDVIADADEVISRFDPTQDLEIQLVQIFNSKGEMIWELLQ